MWLQMAAEDDDLPATRSAVCPDFSGLLPAAEVARLFGRTLRTLSNWERSGLLVPIRLNKRRYYRVADLERLLDA